MADGCLVPPRQTAAERVCQQLVAERLGDQLLVALEDGHELERPRKGPAVGERSGGVDRELAVHLAPRPDGREVLETKAERVHLRVAGRADAVGPVRLE